MLNVENVSDNFPKQLHLKCNISHAAQLKLVCKNEIIKKALLQCINWQISYGIKRSVEGTWRNKTFGRGKKGADNKGPTKRSQNKKGAGKKGEEQKGRRAKRAQSKKGTEQKGREITMLRHRYIQGRNFFR